MGGQPQSLQLCPRYPMDIKLLRAMAVLCPVASSKICLRVILIQNFPVLPPLA